MFRRHPILTLLAALILLATASIAAFLATLDADLYRKRLQASLAGALSEPVHIGGASITLRHGPAIDLTDLRIGRERGSKADLRADHLLLRLEILPLLRREIVFAEILLEAPRVTLLLSPAEDEGPAERSDALLFDQSLFETALVRSLRVTEGSFHFLDRRDPDRHYEASVEDIDARLTDLSLSSPGRLEFSGLMVQEGISSPVGLAGQITPGSALPRWRETGLEMELRLRNFPPAPLLDRYAPAGLEPGVSGKAALNLDLSGSPAEGLRVEADLDGEALSIQPAGLYRSPVPLHDLRLKGTWTSSAKEQSLSGLSVAAGGIALEGALALKEVGDEGEEELWLTGSLSGSLASLPEAARLIPDLGGAAPVKQRVEGGSLKIESLLLAGPVAGLLHPGEDFPLQEATFLLEKGRFRLGEKGLPVEISTAGDWREEMLSLTGGEARLQESSFRFSGKLERPFDDEPNFSLKAGGTLQAGRLPALAGVEFDSRISAEGPLPLRLEASGSAGEVRLEISADLQRVALGLGQAASKTAGGEGSISLSATLTPEHLSLDEGRLSLPPLDLRVTGEQDLGGRKAFALNLKVEDLDMERASAQVPLLKKLRTEGKISLEYELAGESGRLLHRRGTVGLKDFGLYAGRAVAEINHANGRILLSEDRAEIEQMTARLGTSPARVKGSLSRFGDPVIELWVKAESIRADELIFPSEEAIFRDVDGHLVIDGGGIRFDPVRVRLDGGTEASVYGAVENFKAPRVNLNIDAEYGNIDEVIALWRRPEKKGAAAKKPAGKKGQHLIAVQAKAGRIGGLNFQNATGEITFGGGLMTIHPLHFSSGAGYGVGQVVVDSRNASPTTLKISGHVEDFDAAAVYSDLLKREGLVTGSLRGDFYLEGTPGKNFIPTSTGGFNLEIEDGVLHKFKTLSRVFSLLNVSQLFALKLPDMAAEGMPYDKLEATVALKNGVLSTEDLLIDSNAMNLSLVGSLDLNNKELELVMGVKPLKTVDKIVTSIPIAGWLLGGEEKALVTAHFEIKGPTESPEVSAIPVTSVSKKVLGIFKRVFDLPGKVVDDVGELMKVEE